MAQAEVRPAEGEATGSHEEFWTFSQVSQWGSHWVYSSNEYLNQVRQAVISTRMMGIRSRCAPRMVHYAQILLWRFYLKEDDHNKYPQREIIPLAFDAAAQLLELRSVREQIALNLPGGPDPPRPTSDFQQQHFRLVLALDFNIRIQHPSEFLKLFITPQFSGKQLELAECIISDSFLCPCCLVHAPAAIAEGAAIMAAGMTNCPGVVRPKTNKAISFIRDMKCFYEQSMSGYPRQR
jgi:cyclin C